MQFFELLLILLPDITRIGSEGILHASLGFIDPLLNLGGCQVMQSGGFGNGGLTSHQLFYQSIFALGRPTLEIQWFVNSSLLVWSNYKLSKISGGQYNRSRYEDILKHISEDLTSGLIRQHTLS